MAIFTLSITDGNETVDFLDSTNYKVMDGGFNIGSPQKKRELVPIREGFYIPTVQPTTYREATLTFSVYGASRSACLTALHKITRIFRSVQKREKATLGSRGQLSYAWAGATNITYFEMFGADMTQPADILSVGKVHMLIEGEYVIPDINIKIYLSAKGYGISIHSEVTNELAISTEFETARTGGVDITNDGNDAAVSNWIEIDSAQVPGGDPWLTKLQLTSGSTYSGWRMLYIGHQETPFPSTTVLDADDGSFSSGSLVTNSDANPNSARTTTKYHQHSYTGSTPSYSQTPVVYWDVPVGQKGTFFVFHHTFDDKFDSGVMIYQLTLMDIWRWGINWGGPWVTASAGSPAELSIPLGSIVLPPANPDILDYGTLDALIMGVRYSYLGYDYAGTFTPRLDYLSLLPISNGLRMWVANELDNLVGVFIDDFWKGIHYLKRAGTYVSTPFTPLMTPIFLEPAVDQRLYFHTTGIGSVQDSLDRKRTFDVRLYAVPTYETLAE